MPGSAKINILYSLIGYLRMYTCKSYFSKKQQEDFVLCILHGITIFKKLRRYHLHNQYIVQHYMHGHWVGCHDVHEHVVMWACFHLLETT